MSTDTSAVDQDAAEEIEVPPVGASGHFVVLDRIDHPDMVVAYPSEDEALDAITKSLFIDGLCEEDCEDIGYYAEIPAYLEPGYEYVIAPTAAQEAADAL